MATFKEVRDELVVVKATLVEEKEETRLVRESQAAQMTALTDEIKTLKDQIASGNAATPEDLDDILAAVKEIGALGEGITEPGTPAGPPVISPV